MIVIIAMRCFGIRVGWPPPDRPPIQRRLAKRGLEGRTIVTPADAAGKRQRLRDQPEVARFRTVAEQYLQLVELYCVRVVTDKPCGALQLADKGVQRAVLIVRRAEIAQSGVRLRLDALRQCRGQARLADPWLAAERGAC